MSGTCEKLPLLMRSDESSEMMVPFGPTVGSHMLSLRRGVRIALLAARSVCARLS
jgi:hypothetical protein